MAVINDLGFPFTSVGGDRQYTSSEWREYFNALVEGGVVGGVGNELQVKPQTVANKTIYIDTGSILIEGAMRSIETTVDLSFADNISGSTRIDRVVARINFADRKIEFVVKQGTTVAPTLIRDSTFYELSLAQVTLANGYSTITATEIADERGDKNVCGYMGNLNEIPIKEIADIEITSPVPEFEILILEEYKSFELEYYGVDDGVNYGELHITFNGDVGANYSFKEADGGLNKTFINCGFITNIGDVEPTHGSLTIRNAPISQRKTVLGRFAIDYDKTSGDLNRGITGSWYNTSESINKISLKVSVGNFGIGTRFRLVGVK